MILTIEPNISFQIDDEDFARIKNCKIRYSPAIYHSRKAGSTRAYIHIYIPVSVAALPRQHRNQALHRFLLDILPGDSRIVDHINRDTLDCRKANLRIATRSQNQGNSAKRTNGKSSQYKGVHRSNRPKTPFTARLVKKWLGDYLTEKEAALAYNRAALEKWGEFANLNEI